MWPFRRKVALQESPHETDPLERPFTYEVGGGWGNRIEWVNWGTRKIKGWRAVPPKVGDFLTSAMESGRTSVFRFVTVEQSKDPPDRFDATVEDVGYLDELDKETLTKLGKPPKAMFLV